MPGGPAEYGTIFVMIKNISGMAQGTDKFVSTLSEEELDRLYEHRQEEVAAMLGEAYAARERGEYAPLEPLHDLLSQARMSFEARE